MVTHAGWMNDSRTFLRAAADAAADIRCLLAESLSIDDDEAVVVAAISPVPYVSTLSCSLRLRLIIGINLRRTAIKSYNIG
jgi:hypothetical protein